MQNVKRSFWAYCWSGFPLGVVYAIFVLFIILSWLDDSENSKYALMFFSFCLLVAVVASIKDYRTNG